MKDTDQINKLEIPDDTQETKKRKAKTRKKKKKTTCNKPNTSVDKKQESLEVVRLRGVQKCVYFPDDRVVQQLENLAQGYAHASFSSIVQQLVVGFLDAAKNAKATDRSCEIKTTVLL